MIRLIPINCPSIWLLHQPISNLLTVNIRLTPSSIDHISLLFHCFALPPPLHLLCLPPIILHQIRIQMPK